MFNPVFTVFNGVHAAELIEGFKKAGFESLVVDHGVVEKAYKKNYYSFADGEFIQDIYRAEFVVHFKEDDEEIGIDMMENWVYAILIQDKITDESLLEFDKLMIRPAAQKVYAENTDISSTGKQIVERDYYDFDYFHHEKMNAMFYEVWKPFTDLPYCTVVYDFKTVGHEPFFTNLFICSSWGCKDDLLLLKNVWKYFKLKNWDLIDMIDDDEAVPNDDGSIPKITRLQDMVRTRAAHCLPGEHVLLGEPSVWRKPMREVVEQIVENMG